MRLALATALVTLGLAAPASADLDTHGITPPGPTYLRATEAASMLGDQARSLLGGRWGDAWFIPNPGRFEIGVVGQDPIDEVRTLVDTSGFGDVVDIVPVPYTPQQELDALNQLNSLVWPLIVQGKVQTGLGLDDAGLPSVVLTWANNATEADQQTINAAASSVGVSVAITHADRPNLFVLAERLAAPRTSRPTSLARRGRGHQRKKHHRRHRTASSVRRAG